MYQPGEPSGRRVARDQALRLAEAGEIAHALRVLLERAGADPSPCVRLAEGLGRQEGAALQRAYGRIEPRRRLRGGSPQPLLDARPIDFMFVDEGGKSNPEPHFKESFFSLGAVALPEESVRTYVEAADSVKREFLHIRISPFTSH